VLWREGGYSAHTRFGTFRVILLRHTASKLVLLAVCFFVYLFVFEIAKMVFAP